MEEQEINTCATRPQLLVGRFAPSPTGRMHAGNIYASLMSWLIVKSEQGKMVLRIEDLDQQRSRKEYIDALQRDYEMLGLTWDKGPFYQAHRTKVYKEAFDSLSSQGLVYPCFCSRADIHAASAPHLGEKAVYPGTCRNLSAGEIARKHQSKSPSYRIKVPDETLILQDLIQGEYRQNLKTECGDFIVRRADGEFAYQLAVVIDDEEQGVNCIVRGVDLLCSTPQQIYLRQLLNALDAKSAVNQRLSEEVCYAHIPLLVSKSLKRLSKRDHDASLEQLLQQYRNPEGVLGHIAYVTEITSVDEPQSAEELLKRFDLSAYVQRLDDKEQIAWRA